MKTALIDADFLSYVIPYKLKNISTDYMTFCQEIDDYIRNIIHNTGASHYLLFLSDSRSFRNKIAQTKSYKGQRPSDKPFMYHEIRKYLLKAYDAVMEKDLEADDLILMYHDYLSDTQYNSLIVSNDKDLRQIPADFYIAQKDQFVTINQDQADYNFWLSMIVGDSVDNIPGIEGLGPKKGAALLKDQEKFDFDTDYREVVLQAYIEKYGTKQGINNFTENFNLLYILRSMKEWDDFEIKDPIEYLEVPTKETELLTAEEELDL